MIHVVCQVTGDSKEVTFNWSDGTGDFDSYSLRDTPLNRFRAAAQKCREQLEDIVTLYVRWANAPDAERQKWDGDLRQACCKLARAGSGLYANLFSPPPAQKQVAQTVRGWL